MWSVRCQMEVKPEGSLPASAPEVTIQPAAAPPPAAEPAPAPLRNGSVAHLEDDEGRRADPADVEENNMLRDLLASSSALTSQARPTRRCERHAVQLCPERR